MACEAGERVEWLRILPFTSRNNLFLALITLSEGWHNNHHHYAISARQGFFWWEIDVS